MAIVKDVPARNRIFWSLVDGAFLQLVLSVSVLLCVALAIGLDIIVKFEPLTRLIFPFIIGLSALYGYTYFVVHYFKLKIEKLTEYEYAPLFFVLLVLTTIQSTLVALTVTPEGLRFTATTASFYGALAVCSIALLSLIAYTRQK